MLGPDAPISSLMRTDVHTVTPTHRLRDVRELMREHQLHHVPVVDGPRLLGMLSASDLLDLGFGEHGHDEAELAAFLDRRFPISQVMARDLVTVSPSTPIRKAAALLSGGTFHALPVVDGDGDLLGIVTSSDLLRLLAQLPRVAEDSPAPPWK
ncbi:MAG: CBS domain-containing protein [Myxococcales bacterium]|nr:CBS domain-containing protein [Myxococcales bacterium]